jgi:hypothetical protein
MFEAIQSWLKNGSNYQEGLSLYSRYGDNNFLVSILQRSETPFNRQKLNTLLTELAEGAAPGNVADPADDHPSQKIAVPDLIDPPTVSQNSAVQACISPVTPQKNVVQAATNRAELPELLNVTRQRDQTFGELRSLQPHLDTTPEGEPLRILATRLVKLAKKNAELWARYNYMTENGVDPEAPKPKPEPINIDLYLIRERENVRKSLNKAEQRIKGKDKPKQKTLDLIQEKRQLLADIDLKIATIKVGGKP